LWIYIWALREDLTFEKGYVPAATWLPIVARMNEADTKNFAARESNFAMTAGMYLPKVSI
jgi:hypothetical protein